MKAPLKVNDYSRVSNKVKLGIRRNRRAARIHTLQQNRRSDKITRLRKPSSNPNKKKILNQVEKTTAPTAVSGFGFGLTQEQLQIIEIVGQHEFTQNILQAEVQKATNQFDSRTNQDKEIKEIFYEIGKVFIKFRSGNLPIAFKMLNKLPDWEALLKLTQPAKWSTQATFAVTQHLTNSLDMDRACIFYEHYLLPKVRANLSQNKKLDYHLYQSLRVGIYKTNAWLKGVLLPLAANGTSKQVNIICTLLKKMSFNVLSASVALIKLSEMPYTLGSINFLKIFIQKKYNLPQRVLYCLIDFFVRFKDGDKMPVIWHQSLLSLISIYGQFIPQIKKGEINVLVQSQFHELITPQISKLL